MAKQSGTKEVTKTALLEAGCRIMRDKGYSNTGIQEVLDSTGVPKGSFYYYFDSKEDFALQIIEHFDKTYMSQVLVYLEDASLKPIDKLKAYCDMGRRNLIDNNCSKGCLIGNLSQEMSDQSEVLRARLEEVLSGWRNRFALIIKEAQDQGVVDKSRDNVELAEFFLSGWHGAIMRAKTTKTAVPVDAFMKIMFEQVLRA
jgi:TetR/AcrR family transcriptional repressor of nem operon